MRFTFLILVFYTYSLTAQKRHHPISSFDLYYGYRPQFQNFYNQLNTTNNLNLTKPLQMIGFGESGEYAVNRDGHFCGHILYNQIIPQTLFVQDTLKGKITGFVFSFAYGGAILNKLEKFTLLYYLGFNTGRLRIYGMDLLKQKNPFFSPKIGIQPKIKLSKITLTLTLDYEYDISSPNWRRTSFSSGDKANLASLKQTGFTGQFGIGYFIN